MPRQKNPNLKPVASQKETSGGTKRRLKEVEQVKTQRMAQTASKFFKPTTNECALSTSSTATSGKVALFSITMQIYVAFPDLLGS